MTAELEAAFAAQATVGTRPARAYPLPVYGDDTTLFIKGAPQSGVIPASGVLAFDLDGPKTGYQWTVRRVTVTDSGSAAASMGDAVGWIYAGQPSPGLVLPGNLEWIMPVLPNAATWSADQLILQYGEHLLVQVTGGTSGQGVICSVAYQLYRPGTGRGRVEI